MENLAMSIPKHPSLTDFEQIGYAKSLIGKPAYYGSLEGTILESEFKEDGWIHLVVAMPDELKRAITTNDFVTFSMEGSRL